MQALVQTEFTLCDPDNNADCIKEESFSRISEVIMPSLTFSLEALITPMLVQLSREDDQRWLTLICGTDLAHNISASLKAMGVNDDKLLLLTTNNPVATLDLSRRALASGLSHTVVSWTGRLGDRVLAQLDSAAVEGDCVGVVIRERG